MGKPKTYPHAKAFFSCTLLHFPAAIQMKKGGLWGGKKAEITHCPKPAAKTQRVFFLLVSGGNIWEDPGAPGCTWGQRFTQAARATGRAKRMGIKETGPRSCTPCQPQKRGWASLQPLQRVLPRALQTAVRGAECCPKSGCSSMCRDKRRGHQGGSHGKGHFCSRPDSAGAKVENQ